MKKIFYELYKYKLLIVIFILTGFLVGFFVTEKVVNDNAKISFIIDSNDNPSKYFKEEYFKNRIEQINSWNDNLQQGQQEIVIENINYENMLKTVKISQISNLESKYKYSYKITIDAKCFPTIFSIDSQKNINNENRCENYIKKIIIENEYLEFHDSFKLENYYNPYIYGGLTAFGMLFISIAALYILSKSRSEKILNNISDNISVFKTPFHKRYWKFSLECFKSKNSILLMILLLLLIVGANYISISSGYGNLVIGISYIIFAIAALIFGPSCAILLGLLSDIASYFIFHSSDSFFIGYTFNAIFAGLTNAIFLYKTKITFSKILFLRIVISLLINVLFGSLWFSIMNNLTINGYFNYLIGISLTKNLVYLFPQAFLLFIIIKIISKPLNKLRLVDEVICNNISLF